MNTDLRKPDKEEQIKDITSDLKWNKNTSEIVKSPYHRMQTLNRAAKFTSNKNDLRSIYISYIRSILRKISCSMA